MNIINKDQLGEISGVLIDYFLEFLNFLDEVFILLLKFLGSDL